MLVKIRVYDRVKYHAGAEKVAEACYEVERFEILNGEQINIESFGGDVDEHDEYLVLYLSNGESSTFRNSYVDLFIEHNEPNGTTDKEVTTMTTTKKTKENAYTDFIHTVAYSWTWLKMTKPERAAFWRLIETLEKATGTYDNRMKAYHSIYTAYLYGLGYDGFNWRENAEIAK